MTSVGEYLKRARKLKKFSLTELSKKTKIKKRYIEYIEQESWGKLPEFPVVQGFVKSISTHLGISNAQSVALLRRDYPPKKLTINPKPDVSDKVKWNPKLAFIMGVLGVIILVSSYLAYQYFSFNAPPDLLVQRPEEGEKILTSTVVVEGETDSDAIVKVNNQPVLVEEDGSFYAEVEVFEGTNEIIVVAGSRSGKETEVARNIEVKLE